jgi:ubiquinone/menaquinone biosynthesis C-methylase UbiE
MPDFSKSNLSAKFQNLVSRRREESGLYREIAEKLPLSSAQRILDVGTGSGLQLKVIHQVAPHVELFGLDLSEASIRVAQENLKAYAVDLRVGSIAATDYPDNFFDIVTCNSSMSYWKNPVQCFDEIYRILKPGGCAVLFEPQKEYDINQVVKTIQANMAGKSWLRRKAAVLLNKFALQRGSKLGLNLYSLAELDALAVESRFGTSHSITRVTLQNLPIFAQIALTKPHKGLLTAK